MNTKRLPFSLVAMTILMSTGMMSHVEVIPLLLETAGRDAWLSIIVIALPYLLWVAALHAIISKMNGEHPVVWLKSRLGNGAAKVFRMMWLLYFILFVYVTYQDTLTWTNTTYLQVTPELFVAIFLGALCTGVSIIGIRSVLLASGIFLPLVVLLGFFIMFTNSANKDYSSIFPILARGVQPVMNSLVFLSGGLTELIMIMFLLSYSRAVSRNRLVLLSVFLIVLTLGPTLGSISEFGPIEAAKQRYPAFEQWRLMQLGHYIEHMDFFSIYQWLAGACVRMSLGLCLALEMLQLKTVKGRVIGALCLLLAELTLIMMPLNDMAFFMLLKSVYFPAVLAFHLFMFTLFAVLALRGEKSAPAGLSATE
ncbi:endospore germination permease [Paenibacillus sp. GCM10023252]|uniref:endospore germination permease n=1 Tax=Paenibacillus sp. GCM10023252 TaxID=3252649 RepID=UPI0036209302